jgi:hypothetical protein
VFVLGLLGTCQGKEAEGALQQNDPNAIPIIKYLWYGLDLLDIRRGIEGKISFDVSATVQSKHMWHGFDLYDDTGVFMPAAGVTLGQTGFSGRIIGAYPISSGLDDWVQRIYAAFYTGVLLEETRYVTNFTSNYFYYGMPRIGGAKSDLQEIGIGLSWPKLLGASGLSPNYYFGILWPSVSHSNLDGSEGFIHVIGMAYDLDVSDFWAAGKGQVFRLSGDVTYNDGSSGADHDWSHAVLGVSTNLGLGKVMVMPFVNSQISMEDTVNQEDEIWCGVNFTYRF